MTMRDQTPSASAAPRKATPLEALTGQPVTIRLRSGDVLRGRLVRTSRYEIEVISPTEYRLVVFKHAIDYMVPERAGQR